MAKRKPHYLRYRKRSLPIDRTELAEYLCTNLSRDLEDREEWNDLRLQRYAKLRGWLEPKTFPWPNASNAHIPFLITESLRTQDTLHNAVLARHPVVESRAILKSNQEKQKQIDNLLDYQLFAEQEGEELVAELIQQYVEDGNFFAYVPWVRYDEAVVDLRILDPIPDTMSIAEGVVNGFHSTFAQVEEFTQEDDEGYKWKVTYREDGEIRMADVEAYIEDEGARLELCIKKDVRAYDGPVVIPKSMDEYVLPWRCANVQPPSPSNPNGADHVILLDYPTLDEIRRLKAQGYYDLVTDAQMDEMDQEARPDPEQGETNAEHKVLKDEFEGIHGGHGIDAPEEVTSNRQLTRMLCFLGWDVNGDELEEQIVVWMIKETKTILRVRYLSEDYPADPPRRPLSSEAFLKVAGRFYGTSLVELLETIHDLMKINFDQMVDSATIKNIPWFAYRPTSGMNGEVLHVSPGEGIPLANPKEDLYLPQFSTQGDAWGLNMAALLSQLAERASMQGSIQFGQVPQGKASALRTAKGMASIMAQGDARPERILRRFFSGFKNIYSTMHELNQRFLPPLKQYRLIEPDEKGNQVYAKVENVEGISGRMQFVFKAGMFNSNKETAQQVLQTLMSMLINPLTLQLGVVTAKEIHNLLTDFIKLVQHEPTRYLVPPPEGQQKLALTAEEALGILLMGRMPRNVIPKEGHEQHLQKILQFTQSPDAAALSQFIQGLISVHIGNLQMEMQQMQQQQQLMQYAQQFSQSMGGGQGGGPQEPAPQTGVAGNAPVNSGELLDESLPGAR